MIRRNLSISQKNYIKEIHSGFVSLIQMIESVFNPETNHAFGHGEAIRWILKDDKNITIGRVAAFIDTGQVSCQQATHRRNGIL